MRAFYENVRAGFKDDASVQGRCGNLSEGDLCVWRTITPGHHKAAAPDPRSHRSARQYLHSYVDCQAYAKTSLLNWCVHTMYEAARKQILARINFYGPFHSDATDPESICCISVTQEKGRRQKS
jgi:hypothetical protein